MLVYLCLGCLLLSFYVPGQLCAGDEVPLSTTEASASSSTVTSSDLSSLPPLPTLSPYVLPLSPELIILMVPVHLSRVPLAPSVIPLCLLPMRRPFMRPLPALLVCPSLVLVCLSLCPLFLPWLLCPCVSPLVLVPLFLFRRGLPRLCRAMNPFPEWRLL